MNQKNDRKTGSHDPIKSSSAKSAPTPTQGVSFRRWDREKIIALANSILEQHCPDALPAPDPGKALLVVGLHQAGMRGSDLDYRQYAEGWTVHQEGRSSSRPKDILPFAITATESGAIQFDPGNATDAPSFLDAVHDLFTAPLPLSPEPPEGISPDLHRKLCAAAIELERGTPGSWDRGMLIEQCQRMFADPSHPGSEVVGPTQAWAWLSAMVNRGELSSTGRLRQTTYRIGPPPSSIR